MNLKLLPALVAAFALGLLATRAADIYWTNTLGGNWYVLQNWSPNQLPSAGDNAFITQAGTYTVVVDGNVILGSLTAGAASGTQTVSVVRTLNLSTNSVFSSRVVLSVAGGFGGLAGLGDVMVNGLLNWTGGYLDIAGVLNANGGILISGSAAKGLYRTVNNGSTVTWTGGVIGSGSGAVFNNLPGGLFDVQTDAVWTHISGGVLTFNNAGTFRKSAGAGTTPINPKFNNTGTIEVQTGVVSFQSVSTQNGLLSVSAGATVDFASGVHTFGAGHSNNIAGTFQVSGGGVYAATNVTVTLPSLNLYGGLGGDGTWTVNGLINWTGGTIDGVGVLNANGGMVISASSSPFLFRRTVNNGGTVTWTGIANFGVGLGAVFNNLAGGLFEVQTDAGFFHQFGGLMTFNNAGTFRKSAGAGLTALEGHFNNTGTVEAQSGTVQFSSGLNQTSGSTLLKGGSVSANGTVSVRGGLLGGSGPVLGNLNMSGQLSPGLSAGRVEVAGNYAQAASGSYNVEIGGTTAGINYDHVAITGSAQLAGTINVVSIIGFVPALGDRFEIMKFGSRSGSVTFQGLDITNGIYLQPVFSPTNLVLVATNAPLRAAPKLNLAYNGDALWLWWPLGYGAFNVQSTTNLNSPIPWSPVTPAELNRHTFPSAEPMKFFRMIKP